MASYVPGYVCRNAYHMVHSTAIKAVIKKLVPSSFFFHDSLRHFAGSSLILVWTQLHARDDAHGTHLIGEFTLTGYRVACVDRGYDGDQGLQNWWANSTKMGYWPACLVSIGVMAEDQPTVFVNPVKS